MNKNKSVLNLFIPFFFLIILHFGLGAEITHQEGRISGKVIGLEDKEIRVNGIPVSISSEGEFTFTTKNEPAGFYTMHMADLSWTLYLEPGKHVRLTIAQKDVSTIQYTGDLRLCNEYLKGMDATNNQVSQFVGNNWVVMNSSKQTVYMDYIQSVKNIYLAPLATLIKNHADISDTFIDLQNREVDFICDSLVLGNYCEAHFSFTEKRVQLDENSLKRINFTGVNDPKYMALPSYIKFCRSWLNHQVDQSFEKQEDPEHYSLYKIKILFKLIPRLITRQETVDQLLYGYLAEHIETNGIQNSVTFIEQFLNICKTGQYSDKIKALQKSSLESRKGLVIKAYKTVGDFVLEAHIFSPDTMRKDENRSAIVIFHGGGWEMGNASWAYSVARHFKTMGMVAIAVQYRLVNRKDITVPDAMSDARDVIGWLRSNAGDLKILPNKIAAYGWSAGGHLVASAAIFAPHAAGGECSFVPNAIILNSPLISIDSSTGWSTLVFGGKEKIGPNNPIDHVRKNMPPTLILQGRTDNLTPLSQAQLFHDKMLKLGNRSKLIIYDGVGHLFTPSHLDDTGWPQPDKKIKKLAEREMDLFLTELGYILPSQDPKKGTVPF